MATLNEDPGPAGSAAGVVPSEIAERDPSRYWLVFTPTDVFACYADGMDLARALVLVGLGYARRPELAELLSPRPASADEIRHVCSRRGTRTPKPLGARRVSPSTTKLVDEVRRAIYVEDLHHGGDERESIPTSSGPKVRQAARGATSQRRRGNAGAKPFDRLASR